jgi:hypothetical protein
LTHPRAFVTAAGTPSYPTVSFARATRTV